MSIRWQFKPGPLDLPLRVHAAAGAGVKLGAEAILAEAVRLCPKDTEALADSGRVIEDGTTATIAFGADDHAGRDGVSTSVYAVPVHEIMDSFHPNGQPKFLERPFHSESEYVRTLMAETLRAVFT